MTVTVVVLLAVIVVLVMVVGWLLRPGPRRRKYQVELDLTPAAARGELPWDWPQAPGSKAA